MNRKYDPCLMLAVFLIIFTSMIIPISASGQIDVDCTIPAIPSINAPFSELYINENNPYVSKGENIAINDKLLAVKDNNLILVDRTIYSR